jgi:hypothetical protein
LAYRPINTAATDIKASVLTLAQRMVAPQEIDWRQARGTEDRARMEGSIKCLHDDQVARKEHERVWLPTTSSSNERESRMASNQNIQRQIDQVKQTPVRILRPTRFEHAGSGRAGKGLSETGERHHPEER